MKKNVLLLLLSFLLGGLLFGQGTVCVPDSSVAGLSPGIYPDTLLPATGCQFYDTDITFVLPRDTTSGGVTANFLTFTINGITGMPPGMSWACNNQSNGCVYDVSPGNPNPQTLGCVRIWGTPLQLNVADTFTVTISVTATLDISFVSPQFVTFERTLIVFPCPQGNCFKVNQNSICEPATVTFSPDSSYMSMGQSGFTYNWNFNNGLTSSAEFPPTQTYPAGSYIIQFSAVVDTVPYYLLDTVIIETINCTDVGSQPDVYWYLKTAAGATVVPNSAYITGPTLPLNTGITGIQVTPNANYIFSVYDDDSGTFGTADDGCGTNTENPGSGDVTFTMTPGWHTVTNNGLKVKYFVKKLISNFSCQDTILVQSKPAVPTILTLVVDGGDIAKLCPGEKVILGALTSNNLQWYKDNQPIPNETGPTYTVTASGSYTVEAISGAACKTQSLPLVITYNQPPVVSVGQVTNNNNCVYTLTPIPAGNYFYQWFRNTIQDPNAFTNTYTVTQPGNYTVLVTSPATSCSTTVSLTACTTVGIESLATRLTDFEIYPNPASEEVHVRAALLDAMTIDIVLRDVLGREVQRKGLGKISGQIEADLSLSFVPQGVYFLSIESAEGVIVKRLMVE